MTDEITNQPEAATPLDDISGLLRLDITTRGQLDEAEALNILGAVDWIERGRLRDVFTVDFYERLHSRMYDEVWGWAGDLRSVTGAKPIYVEPSAGRFLIVTNSAWPGYTDLRHIRHAVSYSPSVPVGRKQTSD